MQRAAAKQGVNANTSSTLQDPRGIFFVNQTLPGVWCMIPYLCLITEVNGYITSQGYTQ